MWVRVRVLLLLRVQVGVRGGSVLKCAAAVSVSKLIVDAAAQRLVQEPERSSIESSSSSRTFTYSRSRTHEHNTNRDDRR